GPNRGRAPVFVVAMKTSLGDKAVVPSSIVELADEPIERSEQDAQLQRARSFAEPLLQGQLLDTGEEVLAHADGMASILYGVGAAPSLRAAAYLIYAADYLNRPEEVVGKAFGESHASL